MFPPMLLYVRVTAPERNRSGVWLPLFLVWLILLPLVVLVLLLTIVADVVLFLVGSSYHYYTLLLLRCFGVLGAARGMSVHIRSNENDIDINVV